MANNDIIEEGDTVAFMLDSISSESGVVLYKPCATDDCWRIRRSYDDRIIYIQRFMAIYLQAKRKAGKEVEG